MKGQEVNSDKLSAIDKGPWEVWGDRGMGVISNDFKHDVILKILGDFGDNEQRKKYAEALCDLLNTTAQHWLPIETAPRGQQEFIGWDGTSMDVTWEEWQDSIGGPVYIRRDWRQWFPTHWRPAYTPPENEK